MFREIFGKDTCEILESSRVTVDSRRTMRNNIIGYIYIHPTSLM